MGAYGACSPKSIVLVGTFHGSVYMVRNIIPSGMATERLTWCDEHGKVHGKKSLMSKSQAYPLGFAEHMSLAFIVVWSRLPLEMQVKFVPNLDPELARQRLFNTSWIVEASERYCKHLPEPEAAVGQPQSASANQLQPAAKRIRTVCSSTSGAAKRQSACARMVGRGDK